MKTFVVVALLSVIACGSAVNWSKVQPLNLRVPALGSDYKLGQRIVGGEEAKPNSLPYQVGLIIHIDDDKQGWCGGSLISPNYVLTAAHCADKMKRIEVILGAHNIKEDEQNQKLIQVDGANIIVHEGWSQTTLTNDIALLKLPESVQFTDYIKPIRLPSKSQKDQTFVDEKVMASGWGKDSDKATTVSPVLRFVESTVKSNKRCNVRYFGMIQDTHICMNGKGGKSTCNGDSGGPLVITEEDGKQTLVGATSFGIAFGCEIGWPAVFTRVTSYLDWIAEKTDISIRS